ncbi:MAG: hypothetical protein NC930_02995 [Candidatus Omnitrophica bacterium]|nr:hypothetical protein [Candidatus Omnitrophota bacterium]
MKLLLLEPNNAREDPFAQCWFTADKKRFTAPLLALPVIAALTPNDYEVEIRDEKIEAINFNEPCNLVAMSYKTKDALRTYQYAEEFRKRGIPVILGGMHASLLPEEAAQYANAVVVGEAEGIWPEVIRDFETGRLRKIYLAPKLVPLEAAPIPRFDLLKNGCYCVHSIQTSRGCLVGCEFCPVQEMFQGKTRHKPVGRVLEEIEAVQRIDRKKDIFFIDEMFAGGNRSYQKELLKELRRHRINFYCISDFKVMDPRYIWDLARSGCKKISINMPGTCLPQELKAVRAIQKLGIDVWGYFMLGFSFHDVSVFDKIEEFVAKSGMKNVTLTVMTPFANTLMARKISERNGILTTDWNLYDQCHVVFQPERMSVEDLKSGFLGLWKDLEDFLRIRDSQMKDDRRERSMRRMAGVVSLGIEKAFDLLTGKKDQPVDLEAIIGKKKAEVSVTIDNVMERKRKVA